MMIYRTNKIIYTLIILFIIIPLKSAVAKPIDIVLNDFFFVEKDINCNLILNKSQLHKKYKNINVILARPIGEKCFKPFNIKIPKNKNSIPLNISPIKSGETQIGLFINKTLVTLSSKIKIIVDNSKKKYIDMDNKDTILEYNLENIITNASDTEIFYSLLFNRLPLYFVQGEKKTQYETVKMFFYNTKTKFDYTIKNNKFIHGMKLTETEKYLSLTFNVLNGINYKITSVGNIVFIVFR